MFRLDLIEELPPTWISQRGAQQWIKERLAKLEGLITSDFWNLSLNQNSDPVLWNKISRLMGRYETPTNKSFIAKIRKCIRSSIKLIE